MWHDVGNILVVISANLSNINTIQYIYSFKKMEVVSTWLRLVIRHIYTFLGYTHIPLARKCGWQIDSELVF